MQVSEWYPSWLILAVELLALLQDQTMVVVVAVVVQGPLRMVGCNYRVFEPTTFCSLVLTNHRTMFFALATLNQFVLLPISLSKHSLHFRSDLIHGRASQ